MLMKLLGQEENGRGRGGQSQKNRVAAITSLPVCHGHLTHLADQMLVSVILWVHCHSRVAENGFGPCGCHWNVVSAVSNGVTEVEQPPGLLCIFYLQRATFGIRKYVAILGGP